MLKLEQNMYATSTKVRKKNKNKKKNDLAILNEA